MSFKRKAVQFATVAAVFFYGLSGGALAADWQFYSTISVNTFWVDSDLNDTTNYDQQLNPGANIGAEVTVSDTLTGGFEYGTENGSANIVVLYGEWNFGAGSLLVGKDELPVYQGISGQVYDDDRALDGIGEFNPGERAMIRLAFGDFQVAAVENDTQVYTGGSLSDSLSEAKMPTFHARYDFAADTFDAAIGGAVAKFDYNDESVTSYVAVASIGASVNRFRLAAQGWFGQNVGNLAAQDVRGADGEDGYAIYESGAIYDVDAWGVALVAQVAFNDTFAMEAGYGHVDLDYGNATAFGMDNDQVQAYYVNMAITLAEGVQIVPEIGVIDYHETGQDEITYGGAKWEISF